MNTQPVIPDLAAEPLPGTIRTSITPCSPKDAADLKARIQTVSEFMFWTVSAAVGLGVIWGRDVKPKLTVTRDIPTWAIGPGGVWANPDFSAKLKNNQLLFVICHETLHFALGHTSQAVQLGLVEAGTYRVLDPDGARLLGIAQDAVINTLLAKDNVGELTDGCVTLPKLEHAVGEKWKGPLDSVEIFYWLKAAAQAQQQQQGPQGQGKPQKANGQPGQGQGKPQQGQGEGSDFLAEYQGDAGQGCSPAPEMSEQVSQQDVENMRATMREHGAGTAIAQALTPRSGRISYRDVLKVAATSAETESTSRRTTTYARAGRRDYGNGIVMPGRTGTNPRLGVIIDVSGSIDRDTLARIIGETLKLQADFPTSRVYLVTHTDAVCWKGWLSIGGDTKKIIEATAFSGGTQAAPAYDAMREAGRFDAVVHFTDTFIENPWPEPPCKAHRFAVAVVGPAGAEVDSIRARAPSGCKLFPVREG